MTIAWFLIGWIVGVFSVVATLTYLDIRREREA
jgi:hypothetical protein